MVLQESAQMYLKNILIIANRKGEVRSIDLAEEMGFSKPSVSRAVHLLEDNGFLRIEEDGSLKLTDAGRREAISVYQRHLVLMQFLTSIGVSEPMADDDACKIEHIISDETFAKLQDLLTEQDIPYPQATEDELFAFAKHQK